MKTITVTTKSPKQSKSNGKELVRELVKRDVRALGGPQIISGFCPCGYCS